MSTLYEVIKGELVPVVEGLDSCPLCKAMENDHKHPSNLDRTRGTRMTDPRDTPDGDEPEVPTEPVTDPQPGDTDPPEDDPNVAQEPPTTDE